MMNLDDFIGMTFLEVLFGQLRRATYANAKPKLIINVPGEQLPRQISLAESIVSLNTANQDLVISFKNEAIPIALNGWHSMYCDPDAGLFSFRKPILVIEVKP